MKAIQRTLWGLLAVITGLWLWAESPWLAPATFLPLRAALVNGTGVLGMAVMSVAMVLALRPAWLEARLGGLDKMYRLHKWLGISALVLSIAHWASAQAPKWAVGLGLLTPGQRPPRVPPSDPLAQFFLSQRHLAESVGEWAFYGAVALMVLALVKWFPYRVFFKTHRWLAVAYLALVFHAVFLLKFSFWGQALGPVMAVLMLAGTVSAFAVLFRRVGTHRQSSAVIERLEHHPHVNVLEVTLKLQGPWTGHQAGQFAFVTFDEAEGPHPFTVGSAWQGDGRLTFLIKALGDYTRTLPERLQVGQVARVEGPYGRFNFESGKDRQIWVSGGIGIAPFVARMKALAQSPDGRHIELFHCTAVEDKALLARLKADAKAARVKLHVLVDGRDGRINARRIARVVVAWSSADVWFCGPAGFGDSLKQDFARLGLPPSDFHQELFAIR